MALSGRGIGKAARVARTIADLGTEPKVSLPHVAEALQYRLPEFVPPGREKRQPDAASTTMNFPCADGHFFGG